MAVEFHDFTIKVIDVMENEINAVLEEVSGELKSQAAGNTRVDTGKTKGAWSHKVDDANHEATIGNPDENAIWEEFGTGEYALHGGRQGGWFYVDERGKGHFTRGKTPTRAFWHAFNSLKNPIINRIKSALGGL